MNRVVKAAVAVTAFGLGAALTVPAQAEVQYNTARHAHIGGLGEGASVAGSPLGGLLGGLTGGGLLDGLLGGITPKSGATGSNVAGLTEAERDAAIARQGGRRPADPNAAEDVTRHGGPLPELSPIAGGVPLGGGGLTESLPVLSGAARMAQPAAKPGSAAVGALETAAKGMRSPSAETMLAGLAQAARRALPATADGRLAPVVGQVAPAEMAPVMEALPGTTQTAGVDDLTPLVEEAAGATYSMGTKATGSYSDLMTALGWTTDGLTSSVRGSWARQ
ncbi:hypothetical protein [Nonomuraea sp. NPDC049480]|uniref:hypothetical protein n=1 Tax=Nonomuraea sp. NPDC049480 TaxID=3364353 RepID=UPI00379B7F2E